MDYRATKDLTLQHYYGNLQDFYKQSFLGLKYDWQVGPCTLRTGLRHFDNCSDGANGHDPDFYTFRYYGDGVTKGKVDSRLNSAQFHLPAERPHLRRRPAAGQWRQRCGLVEPG